MILKYSILLIVTFFLIYCQSEKNEIMVEDEWPSKIESISPEELVKTISENSDLVLLDVRAEENFTEKLCHFKNAVNIPIDDFEARFEEYLNLEDREIVVYCTLG